MCGKRCLVCNEVAESVTTDQTRPQTSLVKQLRVVFVLRQIFELPVESFQNCFLISGGDNPEFWINVCEHCLKTVEKAELIYAQICDAQRQLMKCKLTLKNKLKSSEINVGVSTNSSSYQDQIYGNVREFVKKNVDYSVGTENCDPGAGDLMAAQLLAIKQTSPQSIPLQPPLLEPKVEAEHDIEKSDRTEIDIGPELPISVPSPKVEMEIPEPDISQENFPCDQCSKVFATSRKLGYHFYKYHKLKESAPTQCPHCDYSHVRRDCVQRHINVVHKQLANHTCEICGRGSKTPRQSRYHQVVKHNKCSLKNCKGIFKTPVGLRNHQLKIHGKEIDLFQCQHCQIICTLPHTLRRHVRRFHAHLKKEVVQNVILGV